MQLADIVTFREETATPVIGMGATVIQYSDMNAYTVIAISSNGRTVTLQRDIATRTDTNGMTDSGQRYTFAPNPKGSTVVAKLGKMGWRIGGWKTGRKVLMGVRDSYYDYSF